jgi:hypothetical protein
MVRHKLCLIVKSVENFKTFSSGAFRLRRRHRIVGTFVGCLSKEPRQEQFLVSKEIAFYFSLVDGKSLKNIF